MAEESTIKMVLEILLRVKGREEAGRILKELEQEAKSLGNELSKTGDKGRKAASEIGASSLTASRGVATLGGSIKSMLNAAGVFLGIAQAIAFVKRAITDLAQERRELNALRVAIESLGIKGGASLQDIRDHLLEIHRSGGPAITETLPVFKKLIGITEDTSKALSLTALASRVSEDGMLDTAAAGDVLANILQGRLAGAATALGLKLEEGATRADILRAAFKRFPEATANIEDSKNAFDRAGAAVKGLGRDIASTLAPAIDFVAGTALPFLVNGIQGAFGILKDLLGAQVAAIVTVGKGLAAALDLKKLVTNPEAYIDGLKKVASDAAGTFDAIWDQALARQEAIFRKGGAAAGAAEAEGRRKAIADAEAMDLEDKKAAARKSETESLKARLSALKEGTSEYLAAQRRILILERDQALAERKTTHETEAAINARFRAEDLALTAKHVRALAAERDKLTDESEKTEQRILQAQIAAAKEGSAERLQLELRLLQAQEAAAIESARRRQAELRRIAAETGTATPEAAGVSNTAVEEAKRIEDLITATKAAGLRERADKEKQDRERRHSEARAAEDQLFQVQLAAAAEGSDERALLELEAIDRRYAEELKRAEGNEDAITALKLARAMERADKAIELAKKQAEREAQVTGDAERARGEAALAELEHQQELQTGGARSTSAKLFEIQRDMLRVQANLDIDEEERRLAADLRELEAERDKALAAIEIARHEAVTKAKLRGESAEEIAKIEQHAEEGRQNINAKAASREEAARRASAASLERVATRFSTAMIRLSKEEGEAKKKAAFDSAHAAIGLLQMLFGKNKGAAVALATIDMFLAVAESLAEHGVPWYVRLINAAAALVQGRKQIAAIKSVNIGGDGGGAGAGVAGQAPPAVQPPRMEIPPTTTPMQATNPSVVKRDSDGTGFARGGRIPVDDGGKVPGPDLGRDTVPGELPDGTLAGFRGGEIIPTPETSDALEHQWREAGGTGPVTGPGGIGLNPRFVEFLESRPAAEAIKPPETAAAGQLVQLDEARTRLARVASVDEAKKIRDQAERRAGELLAQIERSPTPTRMEKAREEKESLSRQRGEKKTPPSKAPALDIAPAGAAPAPPPERIGSSASDQTGDGFAFGGAAPRQAATHHAQRTSGPDDDERLVAEEAAARLARLFPRQASPARALGRSRVAGAESQFAPKPPSAALQRILGTAALHRHAPSPASRLGRGALHREAGAASDPDVATAVRDLSRAVVRFGERSAPTSTSSDQHEHYHFNRTVLVGKRSDLQEFIREFRHAERQDVESRRFGQ